MSDYRHDLIDLEKRRERLDAILIAGLFSFALLVFLLVLF